MAVVERWFDVVKVKSFGHKPDLDQEILFVTLQQKNSFGRERAIVRLHKSGYRLPDNQW